MSKPQPDILGSQHEFPIPQDLAEAAFVDQLIRWALKSQMEAEGAQRNNMVDELYADGYIKAMTTIQFIGNESIKYYKSESE